MKFKIIISLFLSMLDCFILGLYASATFRYNEPIEPYRWVITSMFGLMFLLYFLDNYRKNNSTNK